MTAGNVLKRQEPSGDDVCRQKTSKYVSSENDLRRLESIQYVILVWISKNVLSRQEIPQTIIKRQKMPGYISSGSRKVESNQETFQDVSERQEMI